MLEEIFGSNTRYALLRLLIFNPSKTYQTTELSKKTGLSLASIRAEIKRLEQSGLVRVSEQDNVNLVQIDPQNPLFPELRALFLKAQILTEYNFGKKLLKIGSLAYAALTGYFTNIPEAKTDIFIVGTVNRLKLRKLVRRFQKDMDHSLRYTVMSKKEYQYRNDITDRFLYDIIENRKIVLVDKMPK
ncbi:MAG: winged helix-turn-helix domain-containing protein [Patescibacteria group bacterium]|jgi:predicted transcriptional regulator